MYENKLKEETGIVFRKGLRRDLKRDSILINLVSTKSRFKLIGVNTHQKE